ncbi:MAG: hypothetical protein EPN22_07320 [Nitrospirae bacterium]|nr:MAG: hypothetical protein EPN22_07320 [Nitrospirota bacterium]
MHNLNILFFFVLLIVLSPSLSFAGDEFLIPVSQLYNVEKQIKHQNGIRTVSFGGDRYLFTSGADDEGIVWDTKTWKKIITIKHKHGPDNKLFPAELSFSPDNRTALAYFKKESGDKKIYLWELETGRKIREMECHESGIEFAYFLWGHLPSKIQCESGDRNHAAIIEPVTGEKIISLNGKYNPQTYKGRPIIAYAFKSPYAACYIDEIPGEDEIVIRNISNGEKIKTFSGFESGIYNAYLHPRHLLVMSLDKIRHVFDLKSLDKVLRIKGDADAKESSSGYPAFSLSGNEKLGASCLYRYDLPVTLWDMENGRELRTISAHPGGVDSAYFDYTFKDGRYLVTKGTKDKTTSIWDSRTGRRIFSVSGADKFPDVVFVDAGEAPKVLSYVSSYGRKGDGTMTVYDLASGKAVKKINAHDGGISYAIFFERYFYTNGSTDNTTILWDKNTMTKILSLKGAKSAPNVTIGPDYKLFSVHEPSYKNKESSLLIFDFAKTSTVLDERYYSFKAVIDGLNQELDQKTKALYAPKGEFETTSEYDGRIKSADSEKSRLQREYQAKIDRALEQSRTVLYPYSFDIKLGRYDADRQAFDAEALGRRYELNVPRAKAVELAKNRESIKVEGSLVYHSAEFAELINARLLNIVTNETVAFGKQTDASMAATGAKALPDLSITAISLTEPSGNGILDAGETGTVAVRIKNSGKGAAFGVNLSLAAKTSFELRFNDKTSIGTVVSGEEKELAVEISSPGRSAKTEEVSLKAMLTESNGFDSKPVILAFKAKEFQPPKLQIARVYIEDADGRRVISRGKEAAVTVYVENAGSGAAQGVAVEMTVGSKDIKQFGEGNIRIGSLNPGEAKKVAFSIAVTQRYKGEKNLPISFVVHEAREEFTLKPDIKLAIGEEAPDVKVVRVESAETPAQRPAGEDVETPISLKAPERLFGENDMAVVIGIEKYQNIPKSENSYNDAKLVRAYLRGLGFAERNIEYLTDDKATRSALERTLEGWLPNRLKKGGKVFVYYSGHGAPEPASGNAYIVPYDGDPEYLPATGYPLKRLYESLARLNAAETFVVVDSCFSGAGGRSVLAKGARPLVMTAEQFAVPQGMAVLSSTQGSQISTSSPEKGYGVFTYYFLKALKNGKKNLAEIYDYIKPMIEDEAKTLNVRQSPAISPDIEQLRGRFGLQK